MNCIHQIYGTHCAAGTLVPPQGGREGAGQGAGYAVRASSVQGDDLLRRYQQAEPELYYQLPQDVTASAREQLDPAKAPKRMVFIPSESGADLLALISYRRTGSEDGADSNFAHVLVNCPENRQAWWSNLRCLELWAAPRWVTEDSSGIPSVLEPLADLSEMHSGGQPLISRELVLRFLTAPAGEDWGAAASIVSRRWQRMPPERRCELFTIALGGFLAAGGKLLLVAEPSVAALWFYGILRLLPNIPVFAEMGFSTFEPRVYSKRIALAATCFHHPKTTDVPKNLYSSSLFTMNTYLKRCSRAFVGEGFYAPFVVDRLLRYGWQAVERFLVRLQVGGAQTLQDLEEMSVRLGGAPSVGERGIDA